jgi:hypothetical protein
LDLDGVFSSQAHQAADRWRSIADEVAGEEVTAVEESSLVDMALHLRLGRGVVCLGAARNGGFLVCGSPAVRFCAELIASEWEFAACWLEEIESDAHWAEQEALEAVHAAEDADWERALGHARQACLIESGYDDPRPWKRLKREIERGARQQGALPSAGQESWRRVRDSAGMRPRFER